MRKPQLSRTALAGTRIPALLAAFLAVSMVSGVLVAGLFLPAVGAAGALTKDGLNLFNTMPDKLDDMPPSEGSTMYASDGKTVIARFYEENRVVTPLSRIAPVMRQAIVAIEDSRFYLHGGVDPKGLVRAFVNNELNDGAQIQGASTLTQQVVKNYQLESAVVAGDKEAAAAAVEKTNVRKIKEIRMAIQLEQTLPKDAILERYLNIAAFGQNNYGVEAASQYFFRTTAAKLTLPQAALMAGVVQTPEAYNPFNHPKASKERRDTVLKRMLDLGMITTAQHAAAVATALPTKPQPAKSGCITARNYAYFCDYALKVLITDPRYAALGKDEKARLNSIRRGGYKIVTTLDAKLQNGATQTLMKKIPPADASKVATAAVTIEPGTGRVLAIAQNTYFNPVRGPGNTELNYGVDEVYGGAAGFQVGSTFKPFVLTEWLTRNKGLYTNVTGDQSTWRGSDFTACGAPLTQGTFKVSNSEGSGPSSITAMQATFDSVNLAYMDIASRLDFCNIAKTAEAMGVHLASTRGADPSCFTKGLVSLTKMPTECPSMVLGSMQISPMTMANAYATLAAEGTYCPPTAVVSITDRAQKKATLGATKCVKDAISPDVARGVVFAGKRVFTEGTAIGQGLKWPAGGKTGTTDNSVRTWFVGYTKQRTTAVVVADPTDYPGRYPGGRSLNYRKIGDRYYGAVYGATIAAPLWRSIMNIAMDGLEREDWQNPPSKMLEGSGIRVADVTGRSIGEATGILQAQGFKVRVGRPVAAPFGGDRVAKTSPPGGGRAEKGSTITLYPGDGSQQPEPMPVEPGQPGDQENNNGGNNNGGNNGVGGRF